MQAAQLTMANSNIAQMGTSSTIANAGRWITRLFGCWHREMSRPFSHHGQAYRSCLTCGAERRFNLKNWEMQGEFYYKRPVTKQLHAFCDLAALRRAS